jgi:hypothetical protein
MANRNVFDELRDAARRKAQQLNEQFDLESKVGQGLKGAGDALKKGAEALGETARAAREEAAKIDEQFKVTENVRATAGQAGETFRAGARAAEAGAEEFSRKAEEAAREAGEKAKEVFGSAANYYKRAEQAYSFTASGARAAEAALSGFEKARAWVKENPGKTAVVSLSLIAGVRAAEALPTLGATILGAGATTNWFFNSSLPVVGMRKLTERYNDYLKEQEARLARGEIEEAERASIEFQRNLTKYVGAPLLGAFSVAAGATMIGAAFSGATVTGFPVSLLLGGNPLLNGIWFFANGVICISEGYKFFMIALADQEEVTKVVREIKGLLPA